MDPLELEASPGHQPIKDLRPRMPEPLPVRLIAVENVSLSMVAGQEELLDRFYAGLWEFEKVSASPVLIYRSDNFHLRFEMVESRELIDRISLRPLGIELLSLADAERKLIDNEIEYERQKGITLGHNSLLLRDPAGNWVELFEIKLVG